MQTPADENYKIIIIQRYSVNCRYNRQNSCLALELFYLWPCHIFVTIKYHLSQIAILYVFLILFTIIDRLVVYLCLVIYFQQYRND